MNRGAFDPDWFSRPGDTLSEIMADRCVSREELADRLRTQIETVAGLLTGKIAIDADLASRLASVVGGVQSLLAKEAIGL
jgi:HTH-type transcriptional regulator/antitoxin HigA